jgi:hypothetical protein
LAKAIAITETGNKEGCEKIRGSSGELGCMQHLIPTFRQQSIQVLGYEAEMTRTTVEYVGTLTIQNMIEKGYSAEDIAKIWNQGHVGKCRRGVNSLGVNYDSCSYVQKVLSNYKKLTQ